MGPFQDVCCARLRFIGFKGFKALNMSFTQHVTLQGSDLAQVGVL